jgi:hypothetical protein
VNELRVTSYELRVGGYPYSPLATRNSQLVVEAA